MGSTFTRCRDFFLVGNHACRSLLSFGFYLNLILAVESLERAAEVVASGDLTTNVKYGRQR